MTRGKETGERKRNHPTKKALRMMMVTMFRERDKRRGQKGTKEDTPTQISPWRHTRRHMRSREK